MFWSALSFSSPWLLAAAVALPALWWLLRLIPPPPRRYDFPAIRLLLGLSSRRQTAQSAPLWLILLRLALVLALILAASGPTWQQGAAPPQGPLLLVVDNGWAAGKSWAAWQNQARQWIVEAERADQPVALLATAAPGDGGAIAVLGPLPARAALETLEALRPWPWQTDPQAAATALEALPRNRPWRVIWLSDGLDAGDGATLAAALQTYGRLEMAVPPVEQRARLLLPPSAVGGPLRLLRPAGGDAGSVTLRALDSEGRSLALAEATWAAGANDANVAVTWPSELQARMARLSLEGEDTAAATLLLDGRWSRRAVGLVDEGGGDRMPLLDDLFYSEKALGDGVESRRGTLDSLLQRPLSLIILPDRGALPEAERQRLRAWTEQGGTLVRFAGPDLAGNPDDLLPVRLRRSERLLGGALSWAQPMAVAPMPERGPFAGLRVPADLSVSAQILAEPDLTLADKVWATLTDGTPLVTGAPLGKGWLVLVHTTAWPGWSNLAESGLFPAMLQRLLDRASGVATPEAERPLPALAQLDGFGRLGPPGAMTEAWPGGDARTVPGPRHPPGLYGDSRQRRAVNLAPLLPGYRPMVLPSGAILLDDAADDAAWRLAPGLLTLALLLLLADLALLTRWRGHAAAAALLLLLTPAAEAGDSLAAKDVAAALDSRLAFVLTGDAATDAASRAGLANLSRQVVRRTTTLLAEPDGVDLEHDALAVYPLLYWPLTTTMPALSGAAKGRLNDFMRHGGLLLIDSRDGGGNDQERLRQLTRGLDIPALQRVDDQHVLAKSFYLLHDFPGRWSGAALFAEQGGDAAHDFVSPVLIGGNDWAGAWAAGPQGEPLFALVPGGENQREMAVRFGVNLVIYALTGSYKADQVHLPAILERMRR